MEIKDENGNILDFEKLPKEHQDIIIKAIVDHICEHKELKPYTFTEDNFYKLVEEIKKI